MQFRHWLSQTETYGFFSSCQFPRPTGLLGHWLFERSPIDQRDTLFSWRAFASLHMMFLCVLTGRYGSELAGAQINFARKQRAQNDRVRKPAQSKSTLVQQV